MRQLLLAVVTLLLLVTPGEAQKPTLSVTNHTDAPVGLFVYNWSAEEVSGSVEVQPGHSCYDVAALPSDTLMFGLRHPEVPDIVWSPFRLNMERGSGWALEIHRSGLEIHDLRNLQPASRCGDKSS